MEIVRVIDAQDFQHEVLQSSLPVLVEFWASWCSPCSKLSQEVVNLAQEYSYGLKAVRLNVDHYLEMVSALGISIVPTLALYKEGKLVEQISGLRTKEELVEKVKPFLS